MNQIVSKIIRHPATGPTVIAAISFGGGLAVGIFLGHRHVVGETVEAMQEELDRSVEEIKERSKVVIPEDHPAFQEPSHEITVEEHIRRKLETHVEEQQEVPLVTTNVFPTPEDWDYEVEKRKRSSDVPYILHRDEFFAEEMGLMRKTLIFYVGDETLATDTDPPEVFYEIEQIIGEENLRWGHGSGEEHVVYIRNEKRREEYEVLRDPGRFEVVRLGYEVDSDHVQHASPPKFRSQE